MTRIGLDGVLVSDSALGKWLVSHGACVAHGLRFRETAHGLTCGIDRTLEPGETVISCPKEIAITPAVARKALAGRLPPDAVDHIVMCAYVALHKTGDPACRHGAYVDLLPSADEQRTPMWFSAAEMALLQRTNVYAATGPKLAEWRAEHEQLDLGLSFESYLWAATMLSSRAFPSYLIDGDRENATPILLPGVDVLNHKRGEKVGWVTSPTAVSLVTDVQATGELFNNYGPKSNEEFLFGYGFAVQDNPDDIVILKRGGSEQWHVIRRNGELPPALLDDIRDMVGDEDEADVYDALAMMLKSKLDSLLAPIDAVEGEIRDDVRQAVQWYREGQVAIVRTALDTATARLREIVGSDPEDSD